MFFFGHKEIVTYEEFNIYSFVIPLFHLIFHGECIHFFLIFKASFVFCLQKSKMAAWYNTEIVKKWDVHKIEVMKRFKNNPL